MKRARTRLRLVLLYRPSIDRSIRQFGGFKLVSKERAQRFSQGQKLQDRRAYRAMRLKRLSYAIEWAVLGDDRSEFVYLAARRFANNQ
jgi:hypothetical protein